MKKALVAIDESPVSVSLIEYAFDFAQKEKLDFLDFIHVTAPRETPMIISEPDHPPDLPVPERSLARERIRELIVKHMENPEQPSIPFKLLVISGTPYEEIINQAEKEEYKYLLIGHRGMSNIKRFFIGSVAAKVARHSPCSVLVYHPREKTEG
ncbi:MAG: universal stress protein [Synergistales bacterium]|nr:universal stress protein [Synergistales bacterium]